MHIALRNIPLSCIILKSSVSSLLHAHDDPTSTFLSFPVFDGVSIPCFMLNPQPVLFSACCAPLPPSPMHSQIRPSLCVLDVPVYQPCACQNTDSNVSLRETLWHQCFARMRELFAGSGVDALGKLDCCGRNALGVRSSDGVPAKLMFENLVVAAALLLLPSMLLFGQRTADAADSCDMGSHGLVQCLSFLLRHSANRAPRC